MKLRTTLGYVYATTLLIACGGDGGETVGSTSSAMAGPRMIRSGSLGSQQAESVETREFSAGGETQSTVNDAHGGGGYGIWWMHTESTSALYHYAQQTDYWSYTERGSHTYMDTKSHVSTVTPLGLADFATYQDIFNASFVDGLEGGLDCTASFAGPDNECAGLSGSAQYEIIALLDPGAHVFNMTVTYADYSCFVDPPSNTVRVQLDPSGQTQTKRDQLCLTPGELVYYKPSLGAGLHQITSVTFEEYSTLACPAPPPPPNGAPQ